jgi:hypothetical protein
VYINLFCEFPVACNEIITVGIDASKNWLDIAMKGNKKSLGHFRINNYAQATKLSRGFKKNGNKEERLFCMEHIGVYGQPLWKYLNEKDIEYCVVSGSVINAGL